MWTASAHIITAVIGSGVLSLAWATAQLGWVAGPAAMLLFSFVTYYTSTLLTACYRSGDSVDGKRNYTYMDAVRSNLGKKNTWMTHKFWFFVIKLIKIIKDDLKKNIFFFFSSIWRNFFLVHQIGGEIFFSVIKK